MEMEKRKQIAEETQKLEKRVADIEEEIGIHQHCAKNGLSFDNHSVYALAVSAVRGAKEKLSEPGKLRVENREKTQVHNSKSVANIETSCYNNNVAAEKLYSIEKKLENLSNYGLIQDLGRGFKTGLKNVKDRASEIGNWLKEETKETLGKVREKINDKKEEAKDFIHRRVIVNRTLTKIYVTGNDRKHNPVFAYLSPGEDSSGKMYDADGVVIIPGQNFYDNKNCNGNTHSSGVIKVSGGIGKAEVCISKKDPTAYYVNAMETLHYPIGSTEIRGWKLL